MDTDQAGSEVVKSVWPNKMEAVALHPFTATADDELSFKKGNILKVRITSLSLSQPFKIVWYDSI